MKCPKCNGPLRVLDTVQNDRENEIYRARKCIECGHTFFTVEYEVIENQRFAEDWAEGHRARNKYYKEAPEWVKNANFV